MNISGTKSTYSDHYDEYILTFEKLITKDLELTVEITSNIGYSLESIEKGNPSSKYTINLPKDSPNTYILRVFWAKTSNNAKITVTEKSNYLSKAELNGISIKVLQCKINILPSKVLINNNITCKAIFSPALPNNSNFWIKSEWQIDNTCFEVGKQETTRETASIQLKALHLQKTKVSVKVFRIDYRNGLIILSREGQIEIEITHPYTLTANKPSVCIGDYVTYTINGLQGEEKIVWEAVQHAKLYNGQGTGTATFQATKQGYLKVNVTIQHEQASIPLNSNKVWAGKPTINTSLETSHVMTERNPVTIDASYEFSHYKGDISYAIESEDAEYVTVTETDKKFKIETTIPGTQRGEIKLRLKVSNDCGEVSNLHTIAYDTLPGLDAAKAIDLYSAKEHEFTYRRTYDMTEYVGDLQTFQMFFTFTLERRATFIHIRPFCTEEKCLGFRIYDKQDRDLETPLYTHEASDTYMIVENMPQGEYTMAVDVERDHSNKLEVIFSGYIGGNIPRNPYIIEPDENGFEFSDCRNTETYHANFYYKNEQGESVGSEAGTNNTYYILTLEKPMQLILHTAGSKVSTEFHIMIGEPYDWKVLYHETGGNYDMEEIQADPEVPDGLKTMLLSSLGPGQTYVKHFFPAGEYRFVLNGIKKSNGGLYNGDINFNVVGLPITGNSFDTAFELGTFIGHEFQIKSYLRDIQARKGMGIQKLYYQLNVEKNVDFMLNAKSKSSFLPITFYDSNMRQIASSETEESIRINDMPGGKFYFTIDIAQMTGDELTIEGKGMFRGRDPYFSYNLGTYDKDFTISDTIDTDDGGFYETFKYTDENGKLIYTDEPEAHHVYYKIILQKRMQLIIHTTHSELPLTELHIMKGDPFGWNVLYYKDYGNEGIENDPDIPDEIKQNISFGQICVKINLPAGEYKLVLNGTKRTNGGFRNGVLVTNVIGKVI